VDLYLHLTSRCNLHCSYCYAAPGPNEEREGRDLPFAVARAALHQAQGLGVEDVIVTGGEPLLHPQAVEIVEEAKSLGLGVNLLTNGTLIDQALAHRLAQTCDQITISLDSADPVLHDLHRGCGTHVRAEKGIAILSEVGFPHVVAAAVLTRHNQHERHEDFAAYATSLGAERVSRAVYILQGDPRDGSLRLDFDSFLASLAQELDTAVAQARPRGERPSVAWRDRCGAASGVVAIGADGVVYPCQGLIRPEFAAGSIREEPLGEIYASARILNELRAITVEDIPGCGGCEYRFLCGGGCRALAYNTSRCLSAPIPRDYCAFARLLAEWRLWGTALHQISLSAPAELTL
jgi:radical SAM protein with 4Fe4S-binding SPASM domain